MNKRLRENRITRGLDRQGALNYKNTTFLYQRTTTRGCILYREIQIAATSG